MQDFLLFVIALQSNLLSPFAASKEYQKLAILYLLLASLCLEHLPRCTTGINLKEETSSQWKKPSVSIALCCPLARPGVWAWSTACVCDWMLSLEHNLWVFWEENVQRMSISHQDGCPPVFSPTSRNQDHFWLAGGGYGENRHRPRWESPGV